MSTSILNRGRKYTAVFAISAFVLAMPAITSMLHEIKSYTSINHDFRLKPIIAPAGPIDFLSRWDTNQTSTGSSVNNQIKLPLESTGTYNFIVHWGDETSDTITTWNQTQVIHTYTIIGIYDVNITGICWGWRFNNGVDRLKILGISQWGSLRLGNSGDYFYGCTNMNLTATDAPDLTGTTTLYRTFHSCEALGSSGNMNSWNTSRITSMKYMFYFAFSFNQPIGNWDVSSVTNMELMFYGASSFNQPIGNWNVSSVTTMALMFNGARAFNQPIGNWDVSSLTTTYFMFYAATSFNQPIGSWNVSHVTNMAIMFLGASSFNQPLNTWNVSHVTTMDSMFCGTSFNQPLDTWDVSHVTDMDSMFCRSPFNQPIGGWDVSQVADMSSMFMDSSFRQPIGAWNVSRVTNMAGMFQNARGFNQNISIWNVSRVTNMAGMFQNAYEFNQNISRWNVSRVTNMANMFYDAREFNQNISYWNVSRVINMASMFQNAYKFNQNISRWNVSCVTNMNKMFYGATLSTANYDSLLIGWSNLSLSIGVTFHAGNSKYSSAAASARAAIISNYSWTIIDDGLAQIQIPPAVLGYPIITLVTCIIASLAFVVFKYQKSNM